MLLLLRLWCLQLRWYHNGFHGPYGLLLLTERAGPCHEAHPTAMVAAALGQTVGPFFRQKAAAVCREIYRPWCSPRRCCSAFCGTAGGGLWCMLRRLGAERGSCEWGLPYRAQYLVLSLLHRATKAAIVSGSLLIVTKSFCRWYGNPLLNAESLAVLSHFTSEA